MHSSSYWYRRFAPCHGRMAYAASSPSEDSASWQSRAEAGFAALSEFHDSVFGASGFGMPRPLRFLAYRLELDRDQTAEVAKILERVKIERAQAAVDLRRAASEIAETLESDDFDRERARKINDLRLESSRRVNDAQARAIEDLHRLLDTEQRRRLATLIRSGALKL